MADAMQPLETPVLKVSRPVAACSRCRNAKIKCDGKLPACTSCEKNGRAAECTSTNDQFARGKERSYVSTLETRIDRLQQKLEEARARKPSVVSVPDDETPVPSRRPSEQMQHQEPPTPTTSKAQKRREVSAIDDLVSDFGFLSVNATARDFYGFTTAMSYARLILSACSKEKFSPGMTAELPPHYEAMAMFQYYLNNIFVLQPVFDEAAFYASVDNVYSKDQLKAEPFDHWMVRIVLAITNASMSQLQNDERSLEGQGHVCAALRHAEAVLHPGNISGVQALVMLSLYAMLDPHHFDSWSLIGAASRAMTDLGLHQDPPKGTPMSRGKLELRRRVFHCIYALDRSTSLVQSRAFSFSDDSAKVKVPFHRPSSSAPTTPDPSSGSSPTSWLQSHEQALDLITLRKLQSSWYTDLFQSGRSRWQEPYPYLWDTCDALRKWFEDLSSSTSISMRAFFELDLLYSYVYVLSPSPRVPVILPFAQKLIFEYCICYADLMLRQILDKDYAGPMTFYDAMRVYMTGRQFLDVLQNNTEMLLNGLVPPHPEVKPTTAPPPSMPVAPPPPGMTTQRFNTVRSITCMRQTIDCLQLFGKRWGYETWHQRYRNETATMMDDLTQRLRVMDENARRPSMWPPGSSSGSITGSNGSVTYPSPRQSIGRAPSIYQQTPPQMQAVPAFGAPVMGQHITPPQFAAQPQTFPQQQPVQHAFPYAHPQQMYHQPQQPPFNFNAPAYPHQPFSAAPSQQFAAWAGYSGPSAPDTLDDENATLQRTDTSQETAPQSTNRSRLPSVGDLVQVARRMAGMGPSPRSSTAPGLGPVMTSQAIDPAAKRHRLQIPPTSVLPPLTGTRPVISPQHYGFPHQAPARRASMQDAAFDVLTSTYPPNLPAQTLYPPQPGPSQASSSNPQSNLMSICGDWFFATPHAQTGGFVFDEQRGFTCVVCAKPYWRPETHHTLPGGGGCVDLEPEFGMQGAVDLLNAPVMAHEMGDMPHAQTQWPMQGQGVVGYGFEVPVMVSGQPEGQMEMAWSAGVQLPVQRGQGGECVGPDQRRVSEGGGLIF